MLMSAVVENPTFTILEFETIDENTKSTIIRKVTAECKK